MECKVCGTSLKFEAHDNYVCFDCYCAMDLLRHEEEVQKKTSDEEEQECIPVPTPSHLVVIVITAGLLTAGVNMATNCVNCGKDVDTLAKRRHRCVKVKVKVDDTTEQEGLRAFWKIQYTLSSKKRSRRVCRIAVSRANDRQKPVNRV